MPRFGGVTRILRIPILALFLALLVLPAAAAEKSAPSKVLADTVSFRMLKSPTGAVFRSLFVPGWGQFYTHQYVKAAAAFAIEGTMIYSAIYENDRTKAAVKSAENWSRDPADSLHANENFYRANERFYRDSRNKLLWWLAGTILLSMGDAYADAQLYGLDFSPSLTYDRRTVTLTVACKF
jgi:hypothetical protein